MRQHVVVSRSIQRRALVTRRRGMDAPASRISVDGLGFVCSRPLTTQHETPLNLYCTLQSVQHSVCGISFV